MPTDTSERLRATLVRIARCDMRMRRNRRIAEAIRLELLGAGAEHALIAEPARDWFADMSGTIH